MKEQLLSLLENAKMDMHRAVDALTAEAPDIVAAAQELESHHDVVQAILTLLKSA